MESNKKAWDLPWDEPKDSVPFLKYSWGSAVCQGLSWDLTYEGGMIPAFMELIG